MVTEPLTSAVRGTDRRRLFADLVATGRFCRDTPAGSVLHRGRVSFREISDGDSLHVCVGDDDRVSVHVDRFSPVAGANPDGTCRYSVGAVVAHVVAHVSAQVRRLVRGARGQHRCRLECELVDASGPEASAAVEQALHAPRQADCADAEGARAVTG
ncbi:MAG TPA: hypothetical protein VFO65_01525 [Acidimicrobiales bacterium]|nr:hypothetical protein [Acidimicrobiales bacterium]